MWQKDIAEYCKTRDRCQKANKSTGKRLGKIIKIQEPTRPWEIVPMDWVSCLPPYHGLAYSQTSLVTEIPNSPQNYGQIFIDYSGQHYPSLQHHPQTDGLAGRMIQTLEDMVRRFCAYGLELKNCDGFTHDWCTLLPALEWAHKKSIHASINQPPAIIEKDAIPNHFKIP
ncbi:hypothetical protein O181_027466 [Austropuccinia psidii MF-1]|uniref:Integrase catalytic domain-containing protein n=1 Tax=Austropuccinia psidii MF-1 TaxID=1389203 RepID=A0A9Q3H1G9_9BASI|nr:hypothetical protein [Austropuccinia psidii MF-1]